VTRLRCALTSLLASLAAATSLAAQADVRSVADSGFRAFLVEFEAAERQMLNGSPEAWLALVSRHEPVTVLGPFGGHERTRAGAEERFRWAASRLAPSDAALAVEYLAWGVSGDLAYTVVLERSRIRTAGQDSSRAGFSRATYVFRREAGAWRLAHRHGDHLPERFTPPGAAPAPSR
jgi:ketosteroid isomerase-like protein